MLIASTESQRNLAQTRLRAYIDGARDRSVQAVNRIMTEVPSDSIVKASAFKFAPNHQFGNISLDIGGESGTVHRNAMDQVASRQDIPTAYVRHLEEQSMRGNTWALDLLAHTLNEHHARDNARYLVRTVNGERRSVLSDRYRRIDARPILDELAQVSQRLGAMITDATATDTRVSVKFIRPEILEPTPGEFLVFGMSWQDSDHGKGRNELTAFALRLFCWNGATLESVLRQVHLGQRLSDDVTYSDRTYRLDAEASVSAVRDSAAAILGEESVKRLSAVIADAANTKVDPKVKLADLRKKQGKSIADAVGEAYNRPDVEDLPAGNTAWRWSNALSWVAGHTKDQETRLDLEKAAGDALKVAA